MPVELIVTLSHADDSVTEARLSAAISAAFKKSGDSAAPIISTTSRISATTFRCIADGVAAAATIIPRRIDNISSSSSSASVQPLSARIFVNPKEMHLSERQQEEQAVRDAKVFVVGAGGIGCELLKDLFLAGWRDIEVIDLDTIDATNLNRQFLFRPEDVGKPKSAVAANRILSWEAANNNNADDDSRSKKPLRIHAHHGNVKDPDFSAEWIKRFTVVINGLDNVSARKHVNRLCIEAEVPLVESGTMGYNGQAQPIVRGKYACYDCHPKPAEQKVFAVCTIHSKPTTIVHCVHYARELYGRLFGDNISGAATEFDFLNDTLAGATTTTGGTSDEDGAASSSSNNMSFEYARLLANAVFNDKIRQLLELRNADKKDSNAGDNAASTAATPNNNESGPHPVNVAEFVESIRSGATQPPSEQEADPSVAALLAQLFEAVRLCRARDRTPFDKNDDVSVLFISAATNLRAAVFSISRKSAFEIRTIAGNIVPAIASTNAAIAASAVHLATQLILEERNNPTATSSSSSDSGAQFIGMRQHPTRRKRLLLAAAAGGGAKPPTVWERLSISSFPSGEPNPSCIVCRPHGALLVKMHAGQLTLGDFVKKFLMREMSLVSPCVHTATGTIYEHEDYEKRAGDLMSCWVSPTKPCRFDVDDLNQSLEWTVDIVHDETLDPDTPFLHTVVSAAAAATTTISNTDASSSKKKSGGDDDDDEVIAYHPSAKHQHQQQQREASLVMSTSGMSRQREDDDQHAASQGSKKPPNDVQVINVDE